MSFLELKSVSKSFGEGERREEILSDVSLSVEPGEFVAVVGFSGSGKSTLIRLLAGLETPTPGEALFKGKLITEPDPARALVFQSYSLMPWLTVHGNIKLAVDAVFPKENSKQREERITRYIDMVGLTHARERRPAELSGGMRQRVVIAIALLTDPSIIIADEPTTALDVTIQAEIMVLMLDLCRLNNVGLILITHDLAVVSQVTERIMVVYAGRVVEEGPTLDVVQNPRHPYTRGLIKALPQENRPGSRLNQIRGSMPALDAIPQGCAFNPRCDYVDADCRKEIPDLVGESGHRTACIHVDRLPLFSERHEEVSK